MNTRRSPLFEKLAAIFFPSGVGKRDAARIGRVLADLRAKNAKVSDVDKRCAIYLVEFPGFHLTPEALLKHWDLLGQSHSGGTDQTRLWDTLYQAHYLKHPYPWTQRDFVNVDAIAKAVGGTIEELQKVFARYLDCAEPFFAGHPIGKLLSQLPKFTAPTEWEISWAKSE